MLHALGTAVSFEACCQWVLQHYVYFYVMNLVLVSVFCVLYVMSLVLVSTFSVFYVMILVLVSAPCVLLIMC